MNHRLFYLAALAGSCLALPASAQNIKPGLWEVSNKMQSADGRLEKAMSEMQKQMASMGPDQRKMMEDMMAQQGVNLSGIAGGGVIVKMCMTPEMVAQGQVPMQTQGSCTTSHSKTGANSMGIKFECTEPPSHGEGTVSFTGDTSYAMTMRVTSSAGGNPQTLTMNANAKWLGADCGNIKPPFLPKAQ
jgi:hypothetical protein